MSAPAPASGVREALALAAWTAGHPWWRLRDYLYVARAQAEGVLRRGGADSFQQPAHPRPPTVLLIPGVYESWQFLRPLAALLHRHGHPVHVLPTLGYNLLPITEAAALVADHILTHDLHDVVVVAHSKGGLIGKMAMLPEGPAADRIRSMVAINTPFAGSAYARWVPLPAVRAFVPTDATLVALAAEREVNSRITSVFSRFDPHIPGGSVLEGARNVELPTPGHFRVLADPDLEKVLLEAVEAER